jgi:hypothetical protein
MLNFILSYHVASLQGLDQIAFTFLRFLLSCVALFEIWSVLRNM